MMALVACETSGVLRRALRAVGVDAYSCDLEPAEDDQEFHVLGDVRDRLSEPWDLLIAHPPCTFLTVANTYIGRGCSLYTPEQAIELRERAVDLFMAIADAEIPLKAIENPIGIMSTRYRRPDQIVHPWQFGEDASKATCLWLYGLPRLVPTNVLAGGRLARRANQTASGQNKLGPSADRSRMRARTYVGIASAMAQQWGLL